MDGLTRLLTKIRGLLSGFSAAWLGPAVLAFVSVPLPSQRIMKLLSGAHGSSPHGCWPWARAGGKKRHGPVLQQWRLSWGGCWGKQQRARWPGGGNGLRNDPDGWEAESGVAWGKVERDNLRKGLWQCSAHVLCMLVLTRECWPGNRDCAVPSSAIAQYGSCYGTAYHLPQLSACGMPHPVCMQSGSPDHWEWVLWAGARIRMVLLRRFLPVSTVMALVGHHEWSGAQLKMAAGCSLLGVLVGGSWRCLWGLLEKALR